MTATGVLVLAAAKPPMIGAAAPRLRTTPDNGAVIPLPMGGLAGGPGWFPILFITNPVFATVAAWLKSG